MQGSAGVLTSAQHHILGFPVHFIPRRRYEPQEYPGGAISREWMERTWNVCNVASRRNTARERKRIQKREDPWSRTGKAFYEEGDTVSGTVAGSGPAQRSRPPNNVGLRGRGTYAYSRGNIPHSKTHIAAHWEEEDIINKHDETPRSRLSDALPRGPHDGEWSFATEKPRSLRYENTANIPTEGAAEETPDKLVGKSCWYQPFQSCCSHWLSWIVLGKEPTQFSSPRAIQRQPTLPLSTAGGNQQHSWLTPVTEDVRLGNSNPSRLSLPQSIGSDTPARDPTFPRHDRVSTFPRVSTSPRLTTFHRAFTFPEVRHPGPSNELTRDRWETAQARQEARTEKVRQEARDQKAVDDLLHNDQAGSTKLLEWSEKGMNKDAASASNDLDSAEREAYERQNERDQARIARRHAREEESEQREDILSWYWVCQMDTMPGYWATPWKNDFDQKVCIGAIAVILEGVLVSQIVSHLSIETMFRGYISSG